MLKEIYLSDIILLQCTHCVLVFTVRFTTLKVCWILLARNYILNGYCGDEKWPCRTTSPYNYPIFYFILSSTNSSEELVLQTVYVSSIYIYKFLFFQVILFIILFIRLSYKFIRNLFFLYLTVYIVF